MYILYSDNIVLMDRIKSQMDIIGYPVSIYHSEEVKLYMHSFMFLNLVSFLVVFFTNKTVKSSKRPSKTRKSLSQSIITLLSSQTNPYVA